MLFRPWLFKNKTKNKKQAANPQQHIEHLFEKTKKSSDFVQISITNEDGAFILSYYSSLIDRKLLQNKILHSVQEHSLHTGSLQQLDGIKTLFPIEDIVITDQVEVIEAKLLKGYAALQLKATDHQCALINLSHGNLGLRDQSDVGSMSHTKVAIVYIEGVTSEQHVQTMVQRLQNIDFDVVFDSSQLHQFISDNSLTPFPLSLSTERLDRTVWALINGQVAVLSNGSPYAITAPATLLDFFVSPEDYYLPWVIASFFRLKFSVHPKIRIIQTGVGE